MEPLDLSVALCWQVLQTTSDRNGNSRILVIVYDKDGDMYRVTPDRRYAMGTLQALPKFQITPSDYQVTKRVAKRMGAWRD